MGYTWTCRDGKVARVPRTELAVWEASGSQVFLVLSCSVDVDRGSERNKVENEGREVYYANEQLDQTAVREISSGSSVSERGLAITERE